MARRRMNWGSVGGSFEAYAEALERAGHEMKDVVDEVLGHAAEQVQSDTAAATTAGNFPAGGKYSSGDTAGTIISDTSVQWSGSLGEVSLGFDKTMYGAGGWLITGTPKMRPDYALEKIFAQKSYMNKIQRQIGKECKEILGL